MADPILMAFLKVGLINVAGDDAKFDKLEATANEVAKSVIKTPAKALPYALVAFDGDVDEDQPVVIEVTALLAKEWPTYFNTMIGSPVAIVRAVLLSGLVEASRKDPSVAAAAVAAARNVLPHTPSGAERDVWRDVILDLENRVETNAERAWATPDTIIVKPPEMAFGTVDVPVTQYRLQRDPLQKALETAAGPHNEAGEAGENPNPYWPGSNQAWVSAFGVRAAKAIADAVDPALRSKVGPIDLNAVMGPVADAFNQQIQDALTAVSTATAGLQRRSTLLWWKEALYSPSLRRSYRELTAEQAAAVMAFDLFRACPALTPLSVTAFLRETVSRLPQVEAAPARPFLELATELSVDEVLADLRDAVSSFNLPEGRGPVLSLIARPGPTKPTAAVFRSRTGVPGSTELTPQDLAVWLFRELQACRITLVETGRKAKKGRA